MTSTARAAHGGGPLTTLAAAVAGGGGNLLFHAAATHVLPKADYAALAAVLGVMLVGLVPVGALQVASTRAAAARPSAPSGELLRSTARWGAASVAGGVLGAHLLDLVLAVRNPLLVAQVGSWLGVAIFGAVARGIVLGRQGYRPAAASVLVGTVARLGMVGMLIGPLGVLGAMIATVLGEVAATVLAVRGALSAPCERIGPLEPPLRLGGLDAGLALGGQLGTWTFVAALPVLGRRMLDGDAAGDLAVVATTASGAFVLALAVGSAHFPRLAAGVAGALSRAMRTALLVGAAGFAGLLLAGQRAAEVVAGRPIVVETSTAVALAVLAPMLAIIGVTTSWLVARRRATALLSFVPTALVVVAGIILRPDQPGVLVALTAGAGTLGSLLLAAATVHDLRRPVAEPEPLAPPPSIGSTIELSVVMPTKDGGDALRPAVEAVLATLERGPSGGTEVIVVVDGSTDGSEATVADLPVRVVRLERNQGKGAALRHGFSVAEGRLVGFIDGDGDLDPSALLAMQGELRADPGAWVAVGDRHHPESVVTQTAVRRLLSGVHRWVIGRLFRLDVLDTQCGAKLFRREALVEVLGPSTERAFALDLELLALGSGLGLGRVASVPVRLVRPPGATSSVGPRAVLRLGAATLRVRQRVAAVVRAREVVVPSWPTTADLLRSGRVATGR